MPAPQLDGHIVEMHARVVDAAGEPIPLQRLMLHHILYKNWGRFDGEKRDPVCGGTSESFYGTGEENQTVRFPAGYGYPIHTGDRWQTSWMLMNHRNVPDEAYIEYRAVVDDDPAIRPLTPYWLRVTGCPRRGKIDPIFDVPGTGRRGATFAKSVTWRMAEGGRLIAAGGHAHGGAKELTISQPACSGRTLMPSRPLYGQPDHPSYNVLPVLHEPGPIDMSWVQSATGIPVGKGERLKLTSFYDGALPHTRVMGIMHLYVAHDPAVGPELRAAAGRPPERPPRLPRPHRAAGRPRAADRPRPLRPRPPHLAPAGRASTASTATPRSRCATSPSTSGTSRCRAARACAGASATANPTTSRSPAGRSDSPRTTCVAAAATSAASPSRAPIACSARCTRCR